MFTRKNFVKGMLVVLIGLLVAIPTMIAFASTNASASSEKTSYVEFYSPKNAADIYVANPEHFNATVKDSSAAPEGKGLVLDYKPGANAPLTVAIDAKLSAVDNFQGLALWVDIPASSEDR